MTKKTKSTKSKNKTLKIDSEAKIHKKLKKISDEIASLRKKYIKHFSILALKEVSNYTFQKFDGTKINLSDLFGTHNYLILIHNMGKSCSYCTLWADGFSGVSYFIEKKAAFAVVSPDPHDVQKEFYNSRGWKFNMYSACNSDFIKDMGFYTKQGGYLPGVSVFYKSNKGKISRIAMDYFGPGDFYCSPFHFFDLLNN
jgi:predicted dithiol-disulfide oxidoreductase (DUF899 family)